MSLLEIKTTEFPCDCLCHVYPDSIKHLVPCCYQTKKNSSNQSYGNWQTEAIQSN